MCPALAQMAELVDALVSGTSGESRGGSSPLLGTRALFLSPVPQHARVCPETLGRIARKGRKQQDLLSSDARIHRNTGRI